MGRFARATLGTNNLDHHRTADYAGLSASLGPRIQDRLATMAQIYEAPAVLLIGNDATQQNPLVAWQIRTAVRHHAAKLFIIHSRPIKLHRQAAEFVQVPAGAESKAIEWLASGRGNLSAEIQESLKALQAALQKERDIVVLFGAGISGTGLQQLVALGDSLPGQTRYMALGDYVNSRGAADMGVLPDFLPGYRRVTDVAARDHFGKLWNAALPATDGLSAPAMLNAAVAGRLKALYVVGANPVKTFHLAAPERLSGLDLLVVHEMFMTETAQRADVILPAACGYEKDGTVTNTAGEVQITRRAVDAQGPRGDFDLLRILIHQLSHLGLGSPLRMRNTEAVFDEICQNVSGYGLSVAKLLGGGAEQAVSTMAALDASYLVPAELIFSSGDSLFTSGSLGRFCSILNSCSEAKDIPWSSSPTTQSWWYR